MSSNARTFLLIVGGLMVLGGVVGMVTGVPVFPLGLFGALILIGTLFDLGYRGAAGRRAAKGGLWLRTGEREVNTLTGEAEEVWFDPDSGARRYEPLGSDPNRS
jgi:hypothetical protein